MRKLALLVVLLASPAYAKHYMDNKLDVKQDCSKDGEANIMGNEGKIVLSGNCTKIAITGNHNTVTIESSKDVSVTGNENTVTVGGVDNLSTTGNKNSVTYKKGASGDKVNVSNTGKDNKINK